MALEGVFDLAGEDATVIIDVPDKPSSSAVFNPPTISQSSVFFLPVVAMFCHLVLDGIDATLEALSLEPRPKCRLDLSVLVLRNPADEVRLAPPHLHVGRTLDEQGLPRFGAELACFGVPAVRKVGEGLDLLYRERGAIGKAKSFRCKYLAPESACSTDSSGACMLAAGRGGGVRCGSRGL